MTRRGHLAAVAATEATDAPTCLLCGRPTIVFALEDGELGTFDLCGDCNRAFRDLADALGEAEEARTRRAATVEQVAGQLELEPGDYLVPSLEERLPAVLEAIRTGDWTGVDTMTIGDVVRHHADGFTRAELAEMRAVLRRRS